MLHPIASSETSTRRPGCVSWFVLTGLAAVLIAGIVFATGAHTFLSSLSSTFTFLSGLPEKFQTQHITHTFRESLISAKGNAGDILEVGTLEMSETVTASDTKTALGDLVHLGTTISEIKVPVVYRYHIKLSDDWQLSVKGNVCLVQAPALRPSLPPAIRTDQMEKRSTAGWLRFNAQENLTDLERSLTPTMQRRAATPHRIHQIREAARKSAAEFVRQWLLREQQWSKDAISAILVRVPDEAPPTDTPPAPTLALP